MPVPHLFVCTPPDIKSDRRGHVVSVPLYGARSSPPSATTIPSRVRSSDTSGIRCIGATPGGSGDVGFAAGWWSGDVVLINPVTGALQTIGAGMPRRLDPRLIRVLAARPGGALLFTVDRHKLMLWQKADDGGEAWPRFDVASTLRHTANHILPAVNCNGCFYLLHQDGCLSRVDAASTEPPSLLRMEKLPVASLKRQIAALSWLKDEGRLLESDGEVLFVRQLPASKEEVAIESCTSLSVAGFEVYRLDVKEQRWTTVNRLGADRALFVSAGSSDTPGCRSNCIYFVDDKWHYASPACRVGGGSSWGLYSMEDRRVLFEHRVADPGRGAEVFWFTDADSSTVSDTAAGEAPAELPLHVTEKILCCISPLESARHATVCKSWAATVSARLAKPVPHLFVCTPPDIKSDRRGHVVSVQLDGVAVGGPSPTMIPSRVCSSDTNGMRCIGATPGGRVGFAAGWWSGDVVLVNPVTGVLQGIGADIPYLDHLSNNRVVAAGAGDALFAFDGHKLELWRKTQQGGEEAWWSFAVTATVHHTNPIVSAVNSSGCFYLLHQDGCLSRVDAASPPPLRMEKLQVSTLFSQIGAAFNMKDEGRLLESDGEVIFVRQRPAYDESCGNQRRAPLSRYVAGFEVYRLQDVEEQRCWTKVNELPADRALFVSPGSSFAVRASDTAGCRSNCIYFVEEKRHLSTSPVCLVDGGSSWGVYSMDARRVLFEHRVAEPGRGAEVLWFLPRVV